MYTLYLTEAARKDYKLVSKSIYNDKIQNLLHIIQNNPFQNPPPYKKLVGAYNRHLSKLAYREEFEGNTERSTAAYINIREDASTGLTYKLPLEVEFQKMSSGAYSRRINLQHRLFYQVYEETKEVKILRMWGHYGDN